MDPGVIRVGLTSVGGDSIAMSRLPVVLVALLSLACAWPVGAQSNGTVDTVCDQNRDAQGAIGATPM